MRFVGNHLLLSILLGVSLLGTPCLSWQRSPAVLQKITFTSFPQNTQYHQHHTNEWTTTRLSASPPPSGGTMGNSALYEMLAGPGLDDEKAGTNFFYNDEVISHLHGYMLLVGLFGARDPTFLLCFCGLATLAAGATLANKLPANPRVPALVAVTTLVITVAVRYALQFYEIPVVEGPVHNMSFEGLIVALNIAWGCWGSWQTNESVNGASK